MTWITGDGEVRKIITGMSMNSIMKNIKRHEQRGWRILGEIKRHGYGYGCMMTMGRMKRNGSD